MAQQQLDGPKVTCLLVDLGHFAASHRVRAIGACLQTNGRHPVTHNPRVLAGKFGVCMMDPPIHHALPHRQPDADDAQYHRMLRRQGGAPWPVLKRLIEWAFQGGNTVKDLRNLTIGTARVARVVRDLDHVPIEQR